MNNVVPFRKFVTFCKVAYISRVELFLRLFIEQLGGLSSSSLKTMLMELESS